jgi:hypothetical protein
MNESFARDIAPLFTDRDAHCMGGMGVRLRDFDYMSDPKSDSIFPDHANARHVFARLKGAETPRMPPGGPGWTETQLALFESWMASWLP